MEQFREGISMITISADKQYLAIALASSSIINIYKIENKDIQSCKLVQQIQEHHQQVSCLCFNIDGQLLSASHDRNIFIYEQEQPKIGEVAQQRFENRLVYAKSQKAFYYGCWAKKGKKFMVGGSKVGFVGYYKTKYHQWFTKQIEGI